MHSYVTIETLQQSRAYPMQYPTSLYQSHPCFHSCFLPLPLPTKGGRCDQNQGKGRDVELGSLGEKWQGRMVCDSQYNTLYYIQVYAKTKNLRFQKLKLSVSDK